MLAVLKKLNLTAIELSFLRAHNSFPYAHFKNFKYRFENQEKLCL